MKEFLFLVSNVFVVLLVLFIGGSALVCLILEAIDNRNNSTKGKYHDHKPN